MFGTLLWSSRCFWSSFLQQTEPKAMYNSSSVSKALHFRSGRDEAQIRLGSHRERSYVGSPHFRGNGEFVKWGDWWGDLTKWCFGRLASGWVVNCERYRLILVEAGKPIRRLLHSLCWCELINKSWTKLIYGIKISQ